MVITNRTSDSSVSIQEEMGGRGGRKLLKLDEMDGIEKGNCEKEEKQQQRQNKIQDLSLLLCISIGNQC
jgi:hypothetical protein